MTSRVRNASRPLRRARTANVRPRTRPAYTRSPARTMPSSVGGPRGFPRARPIDRARRRVTPVTPAVARGKRKGIDMLHTSRSAARRAWLPIALVAAVACKQGPTPEVQARLDSLNLVAQQRERMVQELADQSRFLSEISAELAKVRAPIKQLRVSRESPLRASRDSLIQRVGFIP